MSLKTKNGFGMKPLSAKQLLLAKGRGYIYKRKYPQVVVFTRFISDIDKLERMFGGHHYKHGTGMVWVLSDRARLKHMLKELAPGQSKHFFEDIIKPYLGLGDVHDETM